MATLETKTSKIGKPYKQNVLHKTKIYACAHSRQNSRNTSLDYLLEEQHKFKY